MDGGSWFDGSDFRVSSHGRGMEVEHLRLCCGLLLAVARCWSLKCFVGDYGD